MFSCSNVNQTPGPAEVRASCSGQQVFAHGCNYHYPGAIWEVHVISDVAASLARLTHIFDMHLQAVIAPVKLYPAGSDYVLVSVRNVSCIRASMSVSAYYKGGSKPAKAILSIVGPKGLEDLANPSISSAATATEASCSAGHTNTSCSIAAAKLNPADPYYLWLYYPLVYKADSTPDALAIVTLAGQSAGRLLQAHVLNRVCWLRQCLQAYGDMPGHSLRPCLDCAFRDRL